MPREIFDKLSQVLIKEKLVSEKDIKRTKEIQSREGGNLSSILVKEGLIDETHLVSVTSKAFSIPAVNLSRYKIEKESVILIPEKVARQYHLIAICNLSNTLVVAMADPLNIFAVDDLEMITKCKIEPVLSTESDVMTAINKFYVQDEKSLTEFIEPEDESGLEVVGLVKEEFDISDAALEGETTPIVKMVNLIISEALRKRASDIHIEPEEKGVRVRYRIDGELHEALRIPKKSQNAVLARFKIMSGMDITEFRVPQDGRFKIRAKKKEVDFRVSVLPTSFGGKIVLRVLDKSNLSIGLDSLGFSDHVLGKFNEAIARPFGMIMVTGPTGSGKSTTLYSVLNRLNSADKNIISIEDPVEYQLDGITQIQTNVDIGLTFANGLRSLLRQSPDIIMIGEIRDSETADIAVKAALTGQLVLTTLHTNDAVSTISRLVDMGIEPFLIASSVILVAAQRLCRVVCKSCKGAGKDCKKCDGTGYYGRQAVLEVMTVDDKIREMIIDRVPDEEMTKYALSHGMKSLKEDAMDKHQKGVTTMEEVTRITSEGGNL